MFEAASDKELIGREEERLIIIIMSTITYTRSGCWGRSDRD